MSARSNALLLLVVLAGLLAGLGEALLHALQGAPPPLHPGASGVDWLAYAALHLCILATPASLVLSWRGSSRWPQRLACWLAVAPSIFIVADHQSRWRLFPELIQWDPAAHYLRVILISLVSSAIAAPLLHLLASRSARRLSASRGLWLALQLVAWTAPAILWWRLPAPRAMESSDAVDSPLPNLLLITVDTLRPDALGVFGGDATPQIDALLRSGVRAEAWSPSSWTRPAFGALFTGLASAAQGSDRGRGIRPDTPWLPEQLRAAGYHTAAIICNPHLERRWGFSRGFDWFEHSGELERLEPIAQSLWTRWLTRLLDEPSRRGDRMVDRTMRWIESSPPEPWFLWVHLLDPHLPYHLRGADGSLHDSEPGPWIDPLRPAMQGDLFRHIFETRRGEMVQSEAARAALRELYQREVAFSDLQVGRLMDFVRARGGDRELLWVFTSDHGEEFFEHGGFEHGHSLHGELLRVPFGIGGLPELRAGAIHPGLRLQDLAPTLLGLLEVAPLSTVPDGLGEELRSGIVGVDRSAEFRAVPDSCQPPTLLADGLFYEVDSVRWQQGGQALLRRDAQWQRFDLCADPDELQAVDTAPAPGEQELLREWELWKEALDASLLPQEMDPELRERLRALGYID